jgi:hypothetical protein
MDVGYMTLWGDVAALPKWARGKRAKTMAPGMSAEQTMELWGERRKLEGKPAKAKPAPNAVMRDAYGAGPDGATCGGCFWLMREEHNAGGYLKCKKHGSTRGPGTDHRAKWPACGLYEARPKTLIPPTKARGKLVVSCPVCGEPITLRAWWPNARNLVSHGEREAAGVFTKQHGIGIWVDADKQVTGVEQSW